MSQKADGKLGAVQIGGDVIRTGLLGGGFGEVTNR